MTTNEIIAIAKEKLGRDITEQEAQDYMDGKTAIPDEVLNVVSGGAGCRGTCPKCGSDNIVPDRPMHMHCVDCGYTYIPDRD